MPDGVPSSFQENDPWPVYIDRGEGSRVWDVDGNEYVDFHNGFGVMCIGHANPIDRRGGQGADRPAAPTSPPRPTARSSSPRSSSRRFGLPQWRFTNSGTEATMDAVHLARGATGRDMILKIEGSYHGHHDAVMVSVYPPLEALGDRDDPVSVPYGAGYPRALTELTRAVPFNDADALESVLEKIGERGRRADHGAGDDEHQHHPAARGLPRAGPRADRGARRQADLRRGQDRRDDLRRRRHRSASASTPDMITLAKASCGGYPGGAIGMTEELAAIVADGTVHQYGTFNGNPLVMAAAEATLTEVLTDDAYEQLEATNRAPARRLPGDHRRATACPPTPRASAPRAASIFSAGAAVRVPRLPDQGRRRALDPGLALPHEPRHLHDARASRRSGRSRSPTPTRTSSATSTPSRRSPATSPSG